MSEYTITLHTFAGFTAARIMNVGFVASILFLFNTVLTALIYFGGSGDGKYRRLSIASLVTAIISAAALFGLSESLHCENVTALEQAANVSSVSGWAESTSGEQTIFYTRDGEVSKGHLLINGNRATFRIPNQTKVKDKAIDHA